MHRSYVYVQSCGYCTNIYTNIFSILMVSFMTLFDIYWNPLLTYLALETHVFSETNFVFIFSDILSKLFS